MKKKLLPIALLSLFGILLAGCANGAKKDDDKKPDPEPTPVQPTNVAVTGVTLDQTTLSVVKGQKATLTATIAPATATNKEVTWSSDDEDVVTVSKTGEVTAVEVGEATVTVKTKDGNFTASCVVTVIKEITSVAIANKSAFEQFIVDDSESLSITIVPEDNPTALLAAGALKVTSSDPTVASVNGLIVTGLKAGTATITVTLFGKQDTMPLTVGEAIPGIPKTVKEALDIGIEEAPFNGQTGNKAEMSETCFELKGKVMAVAPNGDTGYNAILDDGTAAVYLQISKAATEEIPVKAGDFTKVTCKFTNYYGLLEGVSRKAETGTNASWIPAKDVEIIDALDITPTLATAEDMTAEQYATYYGVCKTNGTKNATGATYTEMKRVNIAVTSSETFAAADKGAYQISKDYGLNPIGSFKLDPIYRDGQKSTMEAFLIGANTGKSKSNAIVVGQTPLAPESVAIDQEAQTIVHGNTLQLSYTTSPAGSYSRTVTWASSATAVGTVDENGLFSALYVGDGTQPTNITVDLGNDVVSDPVAISVFGEDVAAESVELNETTKALFINDDFQLVATPTPAMVSDIPQWSSDHPEIATVDQKGKVHGVAEGTAVITVKFNDNATASCTFTVSWEKGVRATDPLNADEALALVADKANKYTTEKEYYVKGFISEMLWDNFDKPDSMNAAFWMASTAKAQGFEVYNAKAVSGLKTEDVKVGAEVMVKSKIVKYSSTVTETESGKGTIETVSWAAHPAEAIALSEETLELGVGANSTLKVTSTPFYATDEITWLTSDSAIATVKDGKVTAVAEGSATITAFIDKDADGVVDEGELNATCLVTVSVAPDVSLTPNSLLGWTSSNVAYPGEETTKTVNGVKFRYFKVGCYGTGLQFQNNNNGWLRTDEETSKAIVKIVITTQSGKSDATALTVASTVSGLASADALTRTENGVYTFQASDNIKAFQIIRSGGTAYVASIDIYFAA